MKKIFILLMITGSVYAQGVDYNKIILPENAQTTDFAERLVQIAWRNHPLNDIYRRQVNIAAYEVRKSSVAWLENIRLTGNVNEFVLNPGSDPLSRAAFYPKYNISGSISLGTFFTIPYTTKQSKEQLIIQESNLNARKLEIRNLVLKAFNEYQLREKVYKIQTQLILDNETSHKLIEQRFKSGEVTFEAYSMSLASYSQMSLAQLQAERDFKNAKLDLEQLIGMKLEDIR